METYQRELEALVKSSVRAGTEIDVLRLPDAVVSGKGFASAQALEVPAILRSIGKAVRDGYEAVAIGNGFDPGLWEARELFDVPILGMFETVSMYALRCGWRFGVLCSGSSGVARTEELAARYGISGRMIRPVAIGISVPEIVSAFGNESAAGYITKSASALAAELAGRGAETIVVASGALDVFLSTQTALKLAIPVLPSVKVLVQELEAMACMARIGVPFVSRAGRFQKPPDEVTQRLDLD